MQEKEFWEVLRSRSSVRKFKKIDIPKEKIEKIISAAMLAPCGSNVRNYEFIIVQRDKVKKQMQKVVKDRIQELADKMKSPTAKKMFISYSKYFTFFSNAPVVIAVVMKKYDSMSARILEKYESNVKYTSTAGIQNVAAAIENMLLAIASLGLGACWMTGPMIAKTRLEEVLHIKEPDSIIALIPVGVPDEKIGLKTIPKIKNIKFM